MADLIGNYEFDLNRLSPTTGITNAQKMSAAVVWTLVHQLIDAFGVGLVGKWEHVYSSNGYNSTGGHSTTVNQWWNGGVFDLANVTRGNNYSNQQGAMFAIRAPAGFPGGNRPTLLFNFNLISGDAWYWEVLSTNGTLSAPAVMGEYPTTSTVWTTTNTANYFSWALAYTTSDASQRGCHLVLAEDGAFFWTANILGSRRSYTALACLPLEETLPGDAAPWIVFSGGPNVSDSNSDWPSSGYGSGKSAWSAAHMIGHGTVGSSNTGTPGSGVQMIRFNGVSASNYCGAAFPIVFAGGNWSMTVYQRLITTYVGKDPIRQTWPEFPVWIVDNSGCVRGYPRDLWLSYAQTEFDVSPGGTAPITRMMWGEFWVPAPDTVTPITTY